MVRERALDTVDAPSDRLPVSIKFGVEEWPINFREKYFDSCKTAARYVVNEKYEKRPAEIAKLLRLKNKTKLPDNLELVTVASKIRNFLVHQNGVTDEDFREYTKQYGFHFHNQIELSHDDFFRLLTAIKDHVHYLDDEVRILRA